MQTTTQTLSAIPAIDGECQLVKHIEAVLASHGLSFDVAIRAHPRQAVAVVYGQLPEDDSDLVLGLMRATGFYRVGLFIFPGVTVIVLRQPGAIEA
jgi:hypothetical protein